MSDPIRLLGKTGGYTERRDRAMDPDEPEAVDPQALSELVARNAASWPGLRALQRGERAQKTPARRIQEIQAQARVSGIDVHPQLRLVKLAMNGGRSVEHIERRLSACEDRLWPTEGRPNG